MLIGKFTNTMDANGRIIFPADFRKDMGEKIVLAKGLFDKCLCAYSESEWNRLCNALKGIPEAKFGDVQKWLFGSASIVCPDKQGRVFITGELIEHAGLSHDVMFVGMNSRVDVWDAESYDKMYKSIDSQNVAEVLKQIDFCY